jgi:isoquinoline 1-oxidoreductase subunit beta
MQKGARFEELPGTVVEAFYYGPLLAHAAMEPMNASADVREDRCEVWAPTQAPTRCQVAAARVTGLPMERCVVNTTLSGGGFGRRLQSDYVEEAVEVSKAIGEPVKVTWSREDDIRHDFFRPMAVNSIRGAVDDRGTLLGLSHTVVSESILRRLDVKAFREGRGIDSPALDGLLDDFVYDVPSVSIAYRDYEAGVPVGPFRAPDANWNTFVLESFLDEMAHVCAIDPVAFRAKMLERHPRATSVLKTAAREAGWGRTDKHTYQGVAITCWGTVGAIVADVSVQKERVRVDRVTAVMDIGIAVNPDIVISQTQGAINYGLSAALTGKITIRNGRVEQSNFDSFPVLHMYNAPRVEVHLIHSNARPSGIGEAALPGIAPAVGNALFMATGRRARRLPFCDAFPELAF